MADDAIIDGKIVTFFSYKGGAGRTMALANVAWILASAGLKVLVVDWDLDSPGLDRYFHPFLDRARVAATPGVIGLLSDYSWAATRKEERPSDWHREYAQILPHAISLNWGKFPPGGTLDFVSAGTQNRDYSSNASVDWDNFYDRLGGGQFFDALREDMKSHYDYTLIDSRTGLSDIAEICTLHLPDILVDCFTLNEQAIEGAAKVARDIGQRYHYRNIRVLPVPTRIDEAEKDKADIGIAHARSRFDSLRSEAGGYEAADYWAYVAIPYKPFYAYEETLAAFGDAPKAPATLLAAYERLTTMITDGAVTALGEMDEETRLAQRELFVRRRQPPPGEIYLSYVPEDRMWADWIEAVLVRRGIRVLPQSGAGGNARVEASAGASTASRTIAVLSAAYLRSPQARGVWEAIDAADPTGSSRRLIPVRVSEVRLTPPFSERAIVDFTRHESAQAVEDLLRACGYPANMAEIPAAQQTRGPRFPREMPPVWRVPMRLTSFTGRNDVLDHLREELLGSSRAIVLPVALYGLGGVGKTAVALEYAHRYMADYDLVWWISAEQRDRIDTALADLAPYLNIRVSESIADAAQAVREALRVGAPYENWLLIFDNADEPGDLETYFPGGRGHVIVTSRNPAWSDVAGPVQIDVFARKDSLDHLQRKVPSLSREDAEAVAKELGDLPLAIEHAAAWLANTAMPASIYVGLLQRGFTGEIDLTKPLDEFPQAVARTWRLSFERLTEQSPAAARLLVLCAFFAPEPISLQLIYSDEMVRALREYDERLSDKALLGPIIRDIARFSLIKVDRSANAVQVHRLVQAAVRAQLPTQDERDSAMHQVHEVLVGARPRQGDTDAPGNWERYEMIWPHLTPSEAQRCRFDDTRQLLIDWVRYLWKRGAFSAALESATQLEERWRESPGEDDRQTLFLRFHIANVLRSLGRFQEAYALDSEIFAKQRLLLGDDHPHTLLTAGSQAGDLRGLGRFQEALEMDSETYRRSSQVFDEDDPSLLSAANNLAVDKRLVGDCFGARELDRDTFRRRELVLGPRHPYTLHSASMLGRDLREAGEFADSIDLLLPTYHAYREVLGEDVVDTLRTAKSLAVSLRKMGRLDAAYQLTSDATERYARRYEPGHPDALACRLNLACDWSALDDKGAALEIASAVLTQYRATLGETHPFTLVAMNNVSTYLRGTGATAEALLLADTTLEGFTSILGADHPFTLSCAVNKANSLHDVGQLREAERLQRDTLERLKKTLGERHPDALICEANLAVTLRASGRREDGTAHQQLVLAAMRTVIGEDHPNVEALRKWRLQNRDLEAQPT